MNRMKYISGIVANVFLMVFIGMNTASCEDYLDTPVPADIGKEEVEVELALGFADEEDGYTVSGKVDTRSKQNMQNGAFCAELISTASTRAEGSVPDLKPDALYELYVLQYKEDGTLLKLNAPLATPPAVGTKLSYTLSPADDCQLVIIARGKGNTIPAISGNLSILQKLAMANNIFFETNIPTSGATQEEANKMPYVLHLSHVKVTSDGKLQSIDGAHDARLLLKRLATKLTVNWKLHDTLKGQNYVLKEVKLCQVPAAFRILPAEENTEWGATYPSSVSEFTDIYRLTETVDLSAGKKTVWIPANVRGNSAKATSPYYRTKENAPTAASYVELVVDNSVRQERLYYRAYLGGDSPTDFNLYENTDYNWTLNINSTNYRNDDRIQLLDQTPVKSSNLVETSNCFMMQPGTNICFNPYKHEAGRICGSDKWNYKLVDTSTAPATILSGKNIDKVKVLWQTRDNGTSGDFVMGYYVSEDHQENLVNITDAEDISKALVHVKVPVSNGGNAVVAAYHGKDIVWSWHLWITDYVPSRINVAKGVSDYESAQQRTENGTVHKYRSDIWKNGIYANMVMMDRDLGAKKGGFPGIGRSAVDYENYTKMDGVHRGGLIYQWGRKDPFFGSADGSLVEINVIFDGNGVPVGLDKVSIGTALSGSANSLEYTIKHPLSYIKSGADRDWWDNTYSNGMTEAGGAWLWNEGGTTAPNKKSLYDPSPKGWKVPMIVGRIVSDSHFKTGADAGAYEGLQDYVGNITYSNEWEIVLSKGSNYFKYSRYYFEDHFFPKEEGAYGSYTTVDNARGGRIFFLEDNIADDPAKWTIQNTFWQAACAERIPETGELKNLQMGHVWTADVYNHRSGLWAVKPALIQLGYYQRGFGWGVRCIQDNE